MGAKKKAKTEEKKENKKEEKTEEKKKGKAEEKNETKGKKAKEQKEEETSSSSEEEKETKTQEKDGKRDVKEVMAEILSSGLDGQAVGALRMEKILAGMCGTSAAPFMGSGIKTVLEGNLLLSSDEERQSVVAVVWTFSTADRELLEEMMNGEEQGSLAVRKRKYELLVALSCGLVNGQALRRKLKLSVGEGQMRLLQNPVEAGRLREVGAYLRTAGVEERAGEGMYQKREEGRRCYGCGETGHLKATCPKGRGAQKRRVLTCFICKVEGHKAYECPKKEKKEIGGKK